MARKRNMGLTTNTETATSTVLQNVVSNVKPSVRYERLEGREYMVVPMVMLTEGVHAGSNGPLYYPKEELSKTPAVWNHKPVVVYHPTMNGQPISACEAPVIESHKVGLIMNTKFTAARKGTPAKLNAEAWLEVSKLKKVDKRVLESIKKGDPMEVSTGLFTDNDEKEGDWNGEAYDSVARNYRPDHLAILPDQKGACSLEDGAGLLRNEMSHEDLRSRLSEAIQVKKDGVVNAPYRWVMDVFGKFFVYQDGKKTLRQNYEVGEGQTVSLKGVPQEVVRAVKYTTVDGTVINTGETVMKSKKKLVNDLIANAQTHWEDGDRDTLMEMDESVLEKMLPIENAAPAPVPVLKKADPVANAPGPKCPDCGGNLDKDGYCENCDKTFSSKTDNSVVETKGKKAPVGNAAPKPKTPEEWINEAPPEYRGVLNAGLRAHNAKKAEFIAAITANANNKFSKEYLDTQDLEVLEGLAAIAGAPAPSTNAAPVRRVARFIGQGGEVATPETTKVSATTNATAEEDDVLDIPTMNFQKKAK